MEHIVNANLYSDAVSVDSTDKIGEETNEFVIPPEYLPLGGDGIFGLEENLVDQPDSNDQQPPAPPQKVVYHTMIDEAMDSSDLQSIIAMLPVTSKGYGHSLTMNAIAMPSR
jgi:hypothetical protein